MSNRFMLDKLAWRNNDKLRRFPALKGVWIDLLLELDDLDERGIFRGPLDELANLAGVPVKFVQQLTEKKILKGAPAGANCEAYVHKDRHGRQHTLVPSQPGPLWYSSRIVRDAYMAAEARESGKRGGNPHLTGAATPLKVKKTPLRVGVKGEDKGVGDNGPSIGKNADAGVSHTLKGVGDRGGAGVSPASSLPHTPSLTPPTSPDLPLRSGEVDGVVMGNRRAGGTAEEINAIYAAYPRKIGPSKAKQRIGEALVMLRKRSATADGGETWSSWLLGRTLAYAAATDRRIAAGETTREYIPHPTTWFHQGRFEDDPAEWEPNRSRPAGRSAGVVNGHAHKHPAAQRPSFIPAASDAGDVPDFGVEPGRSRAGAAAGSGAGTKE